MLSQFFLAPQETVERSPLADLPISPKFKFKGVDTVKLASLEHLAAGRPLADALGANPCVRQRESGGPWIYRLNDLLVTKLAGLNLPDITALAQDWSRTDEWIADRGDPREIEASLVRLCDYAKVTRAGTKALYLWIMA